MTVWEHLKENWKIKKSIIKNELGKKMAGNFFKGKQWLEFPRAFKGGE